MITYAIQPIDGEFFTMEAEFFELVDGYIVLYRNDFNGGVEKFAAYNASEYKFIVPQQKFTPEEVLEQIRTA